MESTSQERVVPHPSRRGAWHAGPPDPLKPSCPGCDRVPQLAELGDDLVGFCDCGTWTRFRRSDSGVYQVLERRGASARKAPSAS